MHKSSPPPARSRSTMAAIRWSRRRFEYNQKSGRMTAIGNVELISPDGNRMYGDKMDVTDSSDGFVDALRIEMPDNTRMAAEKGERVGGVRS